MSSDTAPPRDLKVSFMNGLFYVLAVPTMYLCGFLLAEYLRTTGVVQTFLAPLLIGLGLPKAKLPYAALFINVIIILVSGQLSAIALAFLGSNNKYPRAIRNDPDVAKTFAGRLHAAHMNTLESMVLFTTAVLVAENVKGLKGEFLGVMALLYVALRVAFVIFYALDIDLMRSLAHATSMGVIILIFLHVLLDTTKPIDTFYHTFAGPLAQIFGPVLSAAANLF